MQDVNLSRYQHSHDYAPDRGAAERNTRRVIALTAVMMAVEILAGWGFHSMALLADGWHMGTHVAAFLITATAYAMARRLRSDQSFSFGTGKIDVLGGYTSAIILGIVAVLMAGESVLRLFRPLPIHYNESIAIGLCRPLRQHHQRPAAPAGPSTALPRGHGHSHALTATGGEDLNLRGGLPPRDRRRGDLDPRRSPPSWRENSSAGYGWIRPWAIVGSAVVGQWALGPSCATRARSFSTGPRRPTLTEEIRRAVGEGRGGGGRRPARLAGRGGPVRRDRVDRGSGAEVAGALPGALRRAQGTQARHGRDPPKRRSRRSGPS